MAMLELRSAERPPRRWSRVGEHAALLAVIAVLFLVELRLGLLYHFMSLIEGMDSSFGSIAVAGAFALWVGGLVYGIRRRIEYGAMKKAKAAAEASAEMAGICDLLTLLPNRLGLRLELRRRLDLAATGASGGIVLGLDIDRFKMLNDISGHTVADRVLVEISDRLATAVGPDDFVARVGPDEFLILSALTDVDEARRLAALLQEEIGRPLWDRAPPFQIRAGFGIASFSAGDASESVDAVIRRVDIALQYAKAEGGAITVFEPDMEVSIRERAELEHALELAIDHEEIEPWFQPVIDLASNRIRSFEILARWTHATRGPVSPTVFVPIAEERGLLGRMTIALLRRACIVAHDWPADIKIAVNISPMEFKNPWLAQEILQTLTEVGFPPRRLEIEITENALVVDHDQAVSTVMSLKNQGISIALDDFGTGYASLHQLRVLPFDKIKIDQSFVRTMVENAESRKIVKAIIGLSSSLGLPTTAEGIETTANADTLRALGCTLGQGFLFSRAVPGTEVPALLAVAPKSADPIPPRGPGSSRPTGSGEEGAAPSSDAADAPAGDAPGERLSA